MTDNLPAVRTAAEVATTDTDSWIQVIGNVAALAERIAGTEFVPKNLRNSVPATAAAILYGREVGLPPMTALTQTHVIEGKPSMSAEAMRAMILAAGHDLEFVEATGGMCTMRARRRGAESWQQVSWSIDMARAAGLLGKDVWKRYPRAMLIARCTTDLSRMVFPDVIHGFRSVEEMQDIGAEEGDTAPVEAASGPTTKVTRKRAAGTRGKGTGAPLEPRTAPPALSGPPLPGEPGFEELAPGQVEEVASGDGAASDDAVAGLDSEDATSSTAEDPTNSGAEDAPDVGASVSERHAASAPESDEEPPSPKLISRPQHRMMMGQFSALGINPDDREERLLITSKIVGRAVASSNDVTYAEAKGLLDTLGRVKDKAALSELLDAIDAQAGETP